MLVATPTADLIGGLIVKFLIHNQHAINFLCPKAATSVCVASGNKFGSAASKFIASA